MKNSEYDVIIVGAGAAGLMCAIRAGQRGRRVLLLDKADAVGEKIRISGGGRCNFTNIHTTPANFISQNPHFCVSALKRYPPREFIKLIEKHGIAYHEKTLGQLFCDDSAKQIITMLLDECAAVGVDIRLNINVSAVSKTSETYALTLDEGEMFTAPSLVIATGGPSIPKMGATGWGYEIAKQFGLNVVTPEAALVPFTLTESLLEKTKELAGVALNARVSIGKRAFEEGLLFTHRGLSGPSILQISSYWHPKTAIEINFMPDGKMLEALKHMRQTNPKQDVHTALSQLLPRKLAKFICDEHAYHGRLAHYSTAKFVEIANIVHSYPLLPHGTEGFRTAEVTRGGVDVHQISSQTFETKAVKGLYFIGEVLDVTGHLGGYNFQWAWASGHAAGGCV
jgi:predicted Rossmann fold flavoprotein